MKKILNPPDYVFLGLIGALVLFGLIALASNARADSLIDRVKGRILLQVQSHGESWYVNPVDSKRYYLGRPADAFRIMREKGIGITSADLAKIPQFGTTGGGDMALRQQLKGKILLQVQSHGEAWYVNPTDQKRYYLGRPADAFQIMRNLGLGIANQDLEKIERANTSLVLPVTNPATSLVPVAIKTSIPKKFLTLITFNKGAESRYEDISWERTIRFKENDDIQIFDVSIWDNGIPTNPDKISVYKFDRTFDPLKSEYNEGGTSWVNYRESFNILNVDVPQSCSSAQEAFYYECSKTYLEAFKHIVKIIVENQPAQHYGIKYTGHGSNAGLFANTLSVDDSQLLLSFINSIMVGKLDFLDWSTNCNMGSYSVIASQYQYADYIISSDIQRGGFNIDWVNDYYQLKPEATLDKFFGPTKTIKQSLIAMVNAEKTFWETATTKNDMIAKQIKQSLSIYDSSKFEEFTTVANLEQGIRGSDILNYIRQNYPQLEQKFYDFRFHYVNNKDFFSWDQDFNGFKF